MLFTTLIFTLLAAAVAPAAPAIVPAIVIWDVAKWLIVAGVAGILFYVRKESNDTRDALKEIRDEIKADRKTALICCDELSDRVLTIEVQRANCAQCQQRNGQIGQ